MYTDVWGPAPVVSFDNFRYYVVFVDYYTKYSWFYPLNAKSEVKPTFIRFQTLVEKYFDCKIKTLYSDGGGEFQALSAHLAESGIQHLKSPPYTPQLIGSVE